MCCVTSPFRLFSPRGEIRQIRQRRNQFLDDAARRNHHADQSHRVNRQHFRWPQPFTFRQLFQKSVDQRDAKQSDNRRWRELQHAKLHALRNHIGVNRKKTNADQKRQRHPISAQPHAV